MTDEVRNRQAELLERPEATPAFERVELEDSEAEEAQARAARERMIARLRLLWENRRFLVRVTALGLLAATLLAFLIPKRYESTARLMPPDSQSNSGLAMMAALSARTGSLGAFAGDLLGLKSSGALLVGILRSRTVQDRLIEQFNLRELYGASRIEDARRKLGSNTYVSEDRKSGIITVTVTDKDPQRATAMAKAYVAELDRLVAEVSTSAARRERVFLEERLKAVKVELDEAAKNFSEFASKNTAIDIKEQGRAMVEAAAALQGEYIAAQTELEGLRQVYTDNNVRVRSLRARIAELKHQLEKLGGLETGAGATANGGKAASGESDSPYPSIRELPLLGVPYADHFRRTKIAEVVFELLTQQYELAKVQEAKEIPTVKVLDEPVVPEKKSFPPRLVIMSLGMLLTFSTAVVWVLGRARWAGVDPQDPAKSLAEEILSTTRASMPWASENGSRVSRITRRVWAGLRRSREQPPAEQ